MRRIRPIVFALLVAPVLPLVEGERGESVGLEAQQSSAIQAAPRDPILFVHGWRGKRSQWETMIARFRGDGWSGAGMYTFQYDAGRPNAETAARIAARVDQILVATRARRIDIVTHSMGALPTRFYLKNLGGTSRVDAWVSLGGPNHGTTSAEICFSAACREMRIGSAFLAALNAGDETPGDVRYATWRSPCDGVIDPDASTILEGAENRETACLGHVELLEKRDVYLEVRDFVAR